MSFAYTQGNISSNGAFAASMLELPLIRLKIHHRTTYRYRQPVSLGPHRLMLRPRESRDLRLISSDVGVPAAVLTWAHDVFGNAVATANFQAMADNLVIDSVAEIQLNAAAWPVFDIAASATSYLSFPKIPSGLDSHREAESSHH